MGLWRRLRDRKRRNRSSTATRDEDRLPTSPMITGSAAGGVWGPRHRDSFLGSGGQAGDGPPDEDFLEPRVK